MSNVRIKFSLLTRHSRLTYISRDHPQVYSYRNMRCDGAQLRDAILNNDTKQ